MNRILRHSAPVLCAVLAATLTAAAQSAPAMQAAPSAQAGGPGGPGGQRAPQKPRNLKVLPDNTVLRKVMHEYEGYLGVECEFCHTAPDPVTHRADRASDANPTKDVARTMIQMTDDLNSKYLAQIPDRHDAEPITCGTCHRGEKHPPAFVPAPRPEGNRPPGGMPAGAPPAAPPPS